MTNQPSTINHQPSTINHQPSTISYLYFMLKIFVYGTLKPGEKYYPIYCQGKVVNAVKVWTKGVLYDLPLGYPAMITGEGKVQGFLLTFAEESVLVKLDFLEGYNPHNSPELNEYQRHKIMVYDFDLKPLEEVWAYLMTLEKVKSLGGVLIPSGWWTGNVNFS
jgi:gamma-glutamylcyclotransferase (GGCT)/AIG2-like uncharacterized protein YtfP